MTWNSNHFQGFFQSGFCPPELYSVTALHIQTAKENDNSLVLLPLLRLSSHPGPHLPSRWKCNKVHHRQTFPQPVKMLRVRCRGKGESSTDAGIRAFSSPRPLRKNLSYMNLCTSPETLLSVRSISVQSLANSLSWAPLTQNLRWQNLKGGTVSLYRWGNRDWERLSDWLGITAIK